MNRTPLSHTNTFYNSDLKTTPINIDGQCAFLLEENGDLEECSVSTKMHLINSAPPHLPEQDPKVQTQSTCLANGSVLFTFARVSPQVQFEDNIPNSPWGPSSYSPCFPQSGAPNMEHNVDTNDFISRTNNYTSYPWENYFNPNENYYSPQHPYGASPCPGFEAPPSMRYFNQQHGQEQHWQQPIPRRPFPNDQSSVPRSCATVQADQLQNADYEPCCDELKMKDPTIEKKKEEERKIERVCFDQEVQTYAPEPHEPEVPEKNDKMDIKARREAPKSSVESLNDDKKKSEENNDTTCTDNDHTSTLSGDPHLTEDDQSTSSDESLDRERRKFKKRKEKHRKKWLRKRRPKTNNSSTSSD